MNSLQDKHNRESVRRPYIAPQIQIYGDLREVTQAQGKQGPDGGTSKIQNNKTGV